MYNSAGSTALAATGFTALSMIVGAWVLVIAGIVILSMIPRWRRNRKA